MCANNLIECFEKNEEDDNFTPKPICLSMAECIEIAKGYSVDEEMIPYIAELLLKGYRTCQSCAGHFEKEKMLPYIYWKTTNELSPDQAKKLIEIQQRKYPNVKVDEFGIELITNARTGDIKKKKAAKEEFFAFLDEVLILLQPKHNK